ncbi:FAD-dependent oxidoreductase [Candidatus Pelagibacter sp. HIMB1321]|uniref:FAD-dependent oxidoreductase n=1 Tax=Candidatus Pelagibacter sp. HIMB1321 TaxID=1388755 RepID=UPI000A07F716|nr:FAD-dependent oxidoreductase [Candidatus Pelagibacter sp. HIMB1321]SMF77872.1 Succinate dehydrogenase/fumarate reductase, flavoprotein subunit [Candidatus Pelagibacter sp. HIMB1321]
MEIIDKRVVDNISTDVVVVGGGAAGVAAANTIANQNLKVVLIEKYGFCGGGAVAGLSGTICGLYEASDKLQNKPKQAVFGFTDEFAKMLEKKGGLTEPIAYGKTFTRVHDPLVWKETADIFLQNKNITTIYHAVVIKTLVEGNDKIEGVQVWSKQGTFNIRSKITIDASGDADVIAMAGLPNFIGDKGKVQNPTMIFKISGVDIETFKQTYGLNSIMPQEVTDLITKMSKENKYKLPRAKIWLFSTTKPNELLCNCTRIIGEDGRELNSLYYKDFTEAETQGRKQIREYAKFFKENLKGCEKSFVTDTGTQVGIRQTRQVDGVYKLKNNDVINGKKFKDGIARSPWPIELHSGNKPKVEWLLDDVYEVPLNCFIPKNGEGIIAAGRCLSAEHEAVASARVTAQCFSYGHAVGHAASISIKENMLLRDIKGENVRRILNKEGARLD